MAKLHEILAVEGDLDSTAKRVMQECVVTFNKKEEHFIGTSRRLEMFDDSRKTEELVEDKALVTTVIDKLLYVRRHVAKYYDCVAAKEITNQQATADVVVDGVVLLEKMPAVLLLGFESKLRALRQMYEAIPTLQPGIDWELDEQRGIGIYKAKSDEIRLKTEKVIEHKVLYEATEKHPAQIEKWTADKPVGRFVIRVWSGMVTPYEKSQLLGRIDTLIRAIKKARQRANTQEIKNVAIADKLFDYIHQA